MPYTNSGKNAMLSEWGSLATYASLHTGNPGENGANEVSGGSYARKSVSWGTPSGGSMSATNQPVFDVPGSTTVSYVGFWSASSGGTFYGYADVTDESFTNPGTYTLTSITVDLNG